MKINKINYEQFAIDYLEGTLPPEDAAEMRKFLSKHPDIAAELEGMKDIFLVPEEDIIFQNKQALKKSEGKVRSLFWRGLGVGLSIAALLTMFLMIQNPFNQNGTSVADKPDSKPATQVEQKLKHDPTLAAGHDDEELDTKEQLEVAAPINDKQTKQVEAQQASSTEKKQLKSKSKTKKASRKSAPVFEQQGVFSNPLKKVQQAKKMFKETFADRDAPAQEEVKPKQLKNEIINDKQFAEINEPAEQAPQIEEALPIEVSPIANNDVKQAPKKAAEDQQETIDEMEVAPEEEQLASTDVQDNVPAAQREPVRYKPAKLIMEGIKEAVVPEMFASADQNTTTLTGVEIEMKPINKIFRKFSKNLLP